MTKIYGIKNCDTVKKARTWLESENISFEFHDFRTDGLTEDMVNYWLEHLDWEKLLNKRSTSYRQLDEKVKGSLNAKTVVPVLLDNPTLIKRPVLETKDVVMVGFKADDYQKALA